MVDRNMPAGGDMILVVARLLLLLLFVAFGWDKLVDFGATVALTTRQGLPMPQLAAVVAVLAEVPLGLLLLVGIWTRPFALILAVYTIATAFVGHRFWELEGGARFASAINFYKNVSITGGCLLLYVTGGGCYSIDALLPGRGSAAGRDFPAQINQ